MGEKFGEGRIRQGECGTGGVCSWGARPRAGASSVHIPHPIHLLLHAALGTCVLIYKVVGSRAASEEWPVHKDT